MTQTHSRPAGNGAAAEQVGETSSQSTHTVDELRPIAGWCPPGGCSARRADELELAVTLAFESGRRYERVELAALELAVWRPLARKTWEQAVAERVADMTARVPTPALRFDDPDWPPVAVPGGGGVRLGPGQIITNGATA